MAKLTAEHEPEGAWTGGYLRTRSAVPGTELRQARTPHPMTTTAKPIQMVDLGGQYQKI